MLTLIHKECGGPALDDSVVERISILKLAFSLPIGDPNHMPVTRDLSAGDRDTILKWLSNPLLGSPPIQPVPLEPPVTDAEEVEVEPEPLQSAGKTMFIRQYKARRRAKLERESGGE